MSETNKVTNLPKKGFRQDKKPTKNQVIKEATQLHTDVDNLKAQTQFMMNTLMQVSNEMKRLMQEGDATVKLLNSVESSEAAVMGDGVMISYAGRLTNEDGTLGDEFQGNRGTGFVVFLGSNGTIPGFEEALVGKVPGDTYELDLTFPEAYDEKLRGKNVKFYVEVMKVFKPIKVDYIRSITKPWDEEKKTLQEAAAKQKAEESKKETK